jgi:hypothetical protein
MPVEIRRPTLTVLANGVPVPRVLSVHIQRGTDQDYAKAQFTVSFPAAGEIKKGSHIVIIGGFNNVIERFVGYAYNPSFQLWPGRITVDCIDVMGFLDSLYPDQEYNLSGLVDEDIVNLVLDVAQIPTNMRDITGDGLLLADLGTDSPALTWPLEESGLDVIKEMDDLSQGRRTRALTSGMVVRRYLSLIPFFNYSKLFTEGVNIISGTMNISEFQPSTSVTIVGADGIQTQSTSTNPYAWQDKPYWDQHAAIQVQGSTPGYINTEDVSTRVLGKLNRNLMKVEFATQDDDLLEVYNTVKVDSVHLYTRQNLILQSLSIDADVSGKWRQSLGCVSELMDNEIGFPVQVAIGPLAGTTLTPIAATPTAPSNSDILASFVILSIDKETLADGSNMYIVTCSDTSTSMQGTIVSRSWTASGPGVVITAGSEPQFTTGFTDLAGSLITIEVTDSNGSVGTASQSPENAGVPIRIRKLYTMRHSPEAFEAFDGNVWRSHTPSGGRVMTCMGHGPIAAAEDMFLYTTDDLVTPAHEVIIRSGVTITAVWIEPDVSTANILAGFADGGTAFSGDGGATWTVKTAPGGSPIRRIILSRFVAGEIHAINDTGYYVSNDYGNNWNLIRSGDFLDLQLSHSRNVIVTTAGALINANTGAAFTFPTLSPAVVIKATTAHIRQDKFYAMDDQGRTYQQFGEVSGSTAMLQGENIPEGTTQDRGEYRDGLTVDMVYFAAGAGGLWKTIDGFRTPAGYLKLRAA